MAPSINPPIQGVMQCWVLGLESLNNNVLHGILDEDVIVGGDNDIKFKIGNGKNNFPNDRAQMTPIYVNPNSV
jgi:hypothetical protein